MNEALKFDIEFRLDLLSKADSVDFVESQHDWFRGFFWALQLAGAIEDSELYVMESVSMAVVRARERILQEQAVKDSSADLLVGVDNEEPEQVSTPAASSGLPVRRLWHFLFFAATKQFHPKLWCPLITQHQARKGLPSGWPPLPGRRSLVGGEGQVRLSSGQASS